MSSRLDECESRRLPETGKAALGLQEHQCGTQPHCPTSAFFALVIRRELFNTMRDKAP